MAESWVVVRAGSCCGQEAAACRWIEASSAPSVTVVAATSAHLELWEKLLHAIPGVRITASRVATKADLCGRRIVLHDPHRFAASELELIRTSGAAGMMILSSCEQVPDCLLGCAPAWRYVRHRWSKQLPSGLLPLSNVLARALGFACVAGTSVSGPPPRITAVAHGHDVLAIASELDGLLRSGTAASEIVVVCSSNAEARRFSRSLINLGVPASCATQPEALLRDLRTVIWLVRLVFANRACQVSRPVDIRNAEVLREHLGADCWDRLLAEVLAIKMSSLESVYASCSDSYLRAKGGIRLKENQRLRSYLFAWEPLCRSVSSPEELLGLARDVGVRCLTPHAARGLRCSRVIVAGMTRGVWRMPSDDVSLRAARQLFYDLISSCSATLTIVGTTGDSTHGLLLRLAGRPDLGGLVEGAP